MLRKRKKANRRIAPKQERRWIDPRVVASVALGAILAAAVGWGSAELSDPQTFPIQSVQIIGDLHHLSRGKLQDIVAPHATGGFFNVNVGSIQRAAMELPWTDSVSVRRVWPDGLHILVTEQVAFARWGEKGLLNARGELFYPEPDDIPSGLPDFHGPDGQEGAVMSAYRDMSRALAPVGLKITKLVLDERRAWRLELDNGIELRLGRVDHYLRLVRFVRAYPKLLASRVETVQSVDFRYTNGFAVLWKGRPEGTTAGVRGG